MSLLTDENKTKRLIQNISMSIIAFIGISAGYLSSNYVSTGWAIFIGFLVSFLSVIPVGYGFYHFNEDVQGKYTLDRKKKALEKYKDNEDFIILTTDSNTRFMIQFHHDLKGVTFTHNNDAINKSIICKVFSNKKFSSIFFNETQKRFIILPKEKTKIRIYCKDGKNYNMISDYILDDDSCDLFKKHILALENFLYDDLTKEKESKDNNKNKKE